MMDHIRQGMGLILLLAACTTVVGTAGPGEQADRKTRSTGAVLYRLEGQLRQTMTITDDDRLVLASGWQTELYGFGPRALIVLKTDGSVPRKKPNGPILMAGVRGGYLHIAAAPGNRYVYVCGLRKGRYTDEKGGKDLFNAVYRVALDVDARCILRVVDYPMHQLHRGWPSGCT